MNQTKNNTISESLKKTRQRRENLVCKTFELKIDKFHLFSEQLDKLNLLFVEAKWLYNHILNSNKSKTFDLFKFDPLINEIDSLDFERNIVHRNLTVIGSQIKQSVYDRMLDSIKSLSKLKKNGQKVGGLKFKSKIGSVELKQFKVTYRFHKSKNNFIKIQNIPGYLKVNGIGQIPQNAEFANATLVKKVKDFYLMATVYVPKEIKTFQEKSVGIDFGIKDTITLSNGEKFDVNFPETKRTRKLRQKLSRKKGYKKGQKRSKLYYKHLNILNSSIEKTNNKKKDKKNKIVSYITNKFETVCVQDENIKGWQSGLFGKKVHNSALGGIMRGLETKSHTLKIVDKYVSTTKLCRNCFKLNKFGLKIRTYNCECGYLEDRDTHSALTNEDIGLGKIVKENGVWKRLFPMEHRELKSQMEDETSVICFANSDVCEINHKSVL